MVTDSVSPERDSIAVSLDARFLVSIKPLGSAYGKTVGRRPVQCFIHALCWSTLLLLRVNPAIARQLACGKPRLNLVVVLVKCQGVLYRVMLMRYEEEVLSKQAGEHASFIYSFV